MLIRTALGPSEKRASTTPFVAVVAGVPQGRSWREDREPRILWATTSAPLFQSGPRMAEAARLEVRLLETHPSKSDETVAT
jgi:hypothetical protein